MTLHIAFVCNGFPIVSETFVTKQIFNASQAGYSVSVHCEFKNGTSEASIHQNLVSKLLENGAYASSQWADNFLLRFFQSLRFTIKHRAYHQFLKSLMHGKNGLSLRDFKNSASFIEAGKIDLVHAHFGPNGVKALVARQNGVISCPIITTFHGYDAHFTPATKSKVIQSYRLLFSEGDVFITNGQFLKNQLIAIGCPPNKIRIIPNGVDTDFFSPKATIIKKNPGTVKLITVGRLIDLKNQSLGIKALKHLIDKNINAQYSVIGSGPLKEDLKKLAKSLDVESKVEFLGNLDQASLLIELHNSDVFLMTSIPSKDGRQETQGIVTLEAQASGLPVIAVKNGGIENTLRHGKTGFLANLGKQEEYMYYVLELANNSELRAELSANAPEFIHANFNDKTVMNTLKSLYAEVLG